MGFLILEVIGSVWTGSLALLADAGHMFTDVAGFTLSLLAIWFASKPPTPANTYGYARLEILAALANGVLLFGMATFILYEAYRRLAGCGKTQCDLCSRRRDRAWGRR
ncbi:MAG: cation diffusion facilitator family transporter [Nitrospira sp.]